MKFPESYQYFRSDCCYIPFPRYHLQDSKISFIIYALLHYYFSRLREMAEAFQFGGCCTSSCERSPSRAARHPHHRLRRVRDRVGRVFGGAVCLVARWQRPRLKVIGVRVRVLRKRRATGVVGRQSWHIVRRRVLALHITLRTELFPLSWERVRTDISVSPAVLPRSLNRLWVAISLSPVFVCFLKSILSSVCIVCCAIVDRRWPQQRLLCHRQRHHRRQHHAALALQRDMFTMDGWRRRAQRMSRRKQSNPKPLKREFVLSFSRLFPASDAWCPVTRASSVRVSVCVCVCRARGASRALWSRAFFSRAAIVGKVLYRRHICYCIFEFSRYTGFRRVSASRLFYLQVLLKFSRKLFWTSSAPKFYSREETRNCGWENWYRVKSNVRMSSTFITAAVFKGMYVRGKIWDYWKLVWLFKEHI